MKKSIVIIIVLTLCSLTLFILVSNKTKTIDFKYNNTYIKVTSNYIDNSLYSTREETITLINGIINYKSIITYEDKNIKPITIEYINKYEEKDGYITTKNKTYYLNDKKLCLDSIDCPSPYLVEINNTNNKINKLNSYNTVKNINPSKEEVELYILIDKNNLTKKNKKIFKNITNDFNIKINIIELTKKNKQELTNKYKLNSSKTFALYLNGELANIDTNLNTHQEIALYLFLRGIDYR